MSHAGAQRERATQGDRSAAVSNEEKGANWGDWSETCKSTAAKY
jgi:hypothetical protein